jgi:hypothetical protein
MLRCPAILASIVFMSAGSMEAAGKIATYTARAAFGGDALSDWGGLGPTSGGGLYDSLNTFAASSPGPRCIFRVSLRLLK